MSNARSPREVCSTTIGTNGLIALAPSGVQGRPGSARLAGGPQLGLWLLGIVLLGRPQLVASPGLLEADRLRYLDGPIEREPQADVLAHALLRWGGEDLLHHVLRVVEAGVLRVLEDQGLKLVVVDGDALA